MRVHMRACIYVCLHTFYLCPSLSLSLSLSIYIYIKCHEYT